MTSVQGSLGTVALAWACALGVAVSGCDRGGSNGGRGRTPPPAPAVTPVARDAVAAPGPAASADAARPATGASATSGDAGRPTSAGASADAGPPAVLTIRVINAGTTPMNILLHGDTNEIMHTRKLPARRIPDASGIALNGELVKFYSVPELALCGTDAGVGFHSLGTPEPHTLQPGEALEYHWDGHQRREVNRQDHGGVCVEVGDPEPGRYRFEFDQPYNAPRCERPVVTLPLAADAPRVIEIHCTPSQARPGEHEESP